MFFASQPKLSGLTRKFLFKNVKRFAFHPWSRWTMMNCSVVGLSGESLDLDVPKECFGRTESRRQIVQRVQRIPWLMGMVDMPWHAIFSWMMSNLGDLGPPSTWIMMCIHICTYHSYLSTYIMYYTCTSSICNVSTSLHLESMSMSAFIPWHFYMFLLCLATWRFCQSIFQSAAATDRSKVGDLKRLVEDRWAVPRICRWLRWVPFDPRSLMN